MYTVAGSPAPAELTALQLKLVSVFKVTGAMKKSNVTMSEINSVPRCH